MDREDAVEAGDLEDLPMNERRDPPLQKEKPVLRQR
jgi:hypothetical protein